ncbi:hypothetical protein CSC94_09670 [Zhengella mangrovi]|uniref:Response regulatory domain-containing protein n=1 Tax=Zhengella mangrovi TaxID=1982044 RepID=A0A2G1QPB7_9HYPH|nr:response regulator [Zhengella mangrovi]PHP67300.1 hypothetical protein CSC94_09670 [Zhengella mangrovi]
MKRCLIVDDSTVIRKVAKRILSSETLRILEAENGSMGLAVCRSELPEYIILDATLPDYTPTEFITTLKGWVEADRMPVILVLLHELDIVPIMRAKRAGAAGYLLKPFDRESLTTRFFEQVEKARQARKPSRAA